VRYSFLLLINYILFIRLFGSQEPFGLEPVDVRASYGVCPQEQAANDHLFALEGTVFRAMLKQKINHDTGVFKVSSWHSGKPLDEWLAAKPHAYDNVESINASFYQELAQLSFGF
jgi:hypothetical protein